MGIRRVSHIVLYVRDVETSLRFYQDVLGFVPKLDQGRDLSQAVFTTASASDNPDNHDLALFRKGTGGQRSGVWRSRHETPDPNEPPAGVYHVSYQVETQEELFAIKDELERRGLLGYVNTEGPFKRVYGHDPDGILFEVSWIPSIGQQRRAGHLPADDRPR